MIRLTLDLHPIGCKYEAEASDTFPTPCQPEIYSASVTNHVIIPRVLLTG